jgi:peptidoglycan-N-acetylglucosamine deacetylase
MKSAQRPFASLSLDLDNVWSYMKTHGDEGWRDFPSYLDPLVDIVLERLARHGLKITVFIVGQDAALAKNERAIRRIAEAGHTIGNHSFSHEPWFHEYTPEQAEAEIQSAEEHIERVTGQRPRGYRGPGFSLTHDALKILKRRGYQFDASTFPTFLGPIARAYYFLKSNNLTQEERDKRANLFGSASAGLMPLAPYLWEFDGNDDPLLEVPVTTMPGPRTPFHLSYLLYLSIRSRALAMVYLRTATELCALRGIGPSFLLHPLDFLGGDVESRVGFFPGMNLPTEQKLQFFDDVVRELGRKFELVDMPTHATALLERTKLERRSARSLDGARTAGAM